MQSALVLIDIQQDYFPGGKNELQAPDAAAAQAALALEFYRRKGLPVYHVRHESIKPGAGFFLPGTPGAEIHPAVAPWRDEPVIVKHAPNAFLRTGLKQELLGHKITQLVIVGMMTHMCIDTTVRAAQDFGFSVVVLEDACATKDLMWGEERIPAGTVQKTIMASLNGTFARVIGAERFLRDAE
ncbi:MAG: nicotinamidase-like amidase [Paenibacillaceae bacterium]|jgi:nicotinamidase-related amidase|nr:nicotinamidase-like amidase [Paenibacillaceae bacterium]